jgi:lipopolysaccharide export system protein LptA
MRVASHLIGFLLLAAAAVAQTKSPAANRDQPIEINADSLEVQQEKQVAIFNGNVNAVQGDMRLKADQLRVFYRQGAKPGEAPRAQGQGQGQGQPQGPAGSIVRIEAVGRVFISSPTQTAQGDQGVYDVERNTITLANNVIITQDRNILRGARAVVDLTTGQARMDGRVFGRFENTKEQKQ